MENDSARDQVAAEDATFRMAFVILAALAIVFLDRFVYYGSQGGQILMYGVSRPVPPTAHCIVFGLGLASAGYFAIDVITTGAEPNLRLLLPILLLLALPEFLLIPGLATAATGFGDRFGVFVMAVFLAVEGTLVTDIPRRLDDPSVISVGSVAAVTLGMAALLWFLRARVTSLLSAP